jgi:hypothetical protein
MLKLYCQKCGALNAYVSEKPNFCQKCGTGFGGQGVIDASLEEGDQEELPEEIPDIDGMNLEDLVDIQSSVRRGEKLGDLMGTSDGKAFDGVQQPRGEKYTMEDFQREAGYNKSNNEEKPET